MTAFDGARNHDMDDRPSRRKRDLFGDFCGFLAIILLAVIFYGVFGE